MNRPTCVICEGRAEHGNLFCSRVCSQTAKSRDADNVKALEAAGFVRDPEIPNVFLKDGVATTIEAVRHVGLAKAIRNHEHAAQARRA